MAQQRRALMRIAKARRRKERLCGAKELQRDAWSSDVVAKQGVAKNAALQWRRIAENSDDLNGPVIIVQSAKK